jgi:hypothetical protein
MSRNWIHRTLAVDIERTDRDWALARAYSELADELTGRADIVVCVGRGTAAGARGAWWHTEAVLELDGRLADIVETEPDISNVTGLSKIAALHGVFIHEIAHANHTKWPDNWQDKHSRHVVDVIAMMEEARIERAALLDDPRDGRWLRASAQLVADSVPDEPDTTQACLLICARHDAGVFTADDIEPVKTYLEKSIGADTYNKLRTVWQDTITVEDGDIDSLATLAQRWCDTLTEAGLAPPQPDSDRSGNKPANGSAGDSESDSGSSGSEPSGIKAAIEAAAKAAKAGAEADIETSVEDETATDAETAERLSREREQAEAAKQRTDDATESKKVADKTFGHGYGNSPHTASVTGWRPPTAAEHGAAVQLARVLTNDLYRPPSWTEKASTTPPGTLRMRAAVKQSAQLATGAKMTAKPFIARKRVVDPPLTLRVALAVDRSGSMNGVIADACSAAYILGSATSRVGGRFAAVTFGKNIEPMCLPGTYPTAVPRMRADAGEEAIGTGLNALIGSLELRNERHVRLVVILSDGRWVNRNEDAKGKKLIAELVASGCRVIIANSTQPNPATGATPVLLGRGSVADTVAAELRKVLKRP